MRAYLFLDGDPAKLAGWKFVTDRSDGNGPCLWPSAMREGDAYPDHFLLASQVGDCWQLTCLSNNESRRAELEAALTTAASKAGLARYDSAKAFAAAKPTRADAYLYERVPVLDKDGKPTGETAKRPGAPLQLKACLAGDDAIEAADPKPVVVERVR